MARWASAARPAVAPYPSKISNLQSTDFSLFSAFVDYGL